MKYESTILKRLIDTYGVVGNPCYLSEIIKEFIVRGKELYPHLFTYQSDWLAHIDEFGLSPEYTISYTGQHIYAPNTKEKPVKSAILKGQTLVNLLDMNNLTQQNPITYIVSLTTMKSEITIIATNKTVNKFPRISLYNENGTWVRNVNASFTNNKIHYKAESGLYVKEFVFTTNNNANDSYSYKSVEQFREQGYVVIEGNYEKDVPSYFEGMQSVKMPVLTTSNEDGTKTNILTVNEDVTLRSNGSVYDELDCLTGKLTQRIDENGEVLTRDIVKTVDLTILDRNGQSVEHLKSFNGGTHVYTSSLEGSLVPSVVISVVTNLEETLKICSLDGNTM